MILWYVANSRFPTEKAHGVQIAKACEAFTKAGQKVTLLVPARKTSILVSAFEYYGIRIPFPVRKLFAIDLVAFGKLGFWIESFSFAAATFIHLRQHLQNGIYSRDELVLFFLYLGGARNIFWESHDGTWNFFSRFIAARSKGIVVVSHGLKDFYTKKGIPTEKIHDVPNGITFADFEQVESKQEARARLNLPQDVKLVLYIGALDGWKGTDTLFEASKLLPDTIQVAIIGGEKNRIACLKMQYPHVLFLGQQPYRELPNNQAAADVLVVPNTGKNDVSLRFTSPLKLIAHMASNRPIVASDLPSIRELVGDATAILVTPDSPEALVQGILQALGSRGQEVTMSAKERVEALDWNRRAQGIVRFITSRI